MLRATVIARCKYNIFPFRIWSIYSACASPLVSCTYVILRDSQLTDRPLDKTTETLHSFFDLCEAAVGRYLDETYLPQFLHNSSWPVKAAAILIRRSAPSRPMKLNDLTFEICHTERWVVLT